MKHGYLQKDETPSFTESDDSIILKFKDHYIKVDKIELLKVRENPDSILELEKLARYTHQHFQYNTSLGMQFTWED